MKFFKLPDLGEGLQEAEIIEWQVKVGDQVKMDQTLVVVETAKAMVEIPSPQNGVIARCFGDAGDFIYINEPLIEFEGEDEDDTGTVVGDIRRATSDGNDTNSEDEDFFIVGAAPADSVKSRDVTDNTLRGPRRAMANNIGNSHAHGSCVSLFDTADIDHWDPNTDVTVKLCQAIVTAVAAQPILNSWFDENQLTLTTHPHINLALAVDTPQGLFAPVMQDIACRDEQSLRTGLNQLRRDVMSRNIPLQELQGATIALSNFGTIGVKHDLPRCGSHATPLIIPPSVAIIGTGSIRPQAVVTSQGVEAHRVLPLSLTFDHRVITGAEAAVFLGTLIQALMLGSEL